MVLQENIGEGHQTDKPVNAEENDVDHKIDYAENDKQHFHRFDDGPQDKVHFTDSNDEMANEDDGVEDDLPDTF